MAENSKIEWTDHTANFWWGCVKVSPGCKHCYAETLVNRFGEQGIWGPAKTTGRERKKGIWKELPKWNRLAEREGKRRRVFVQSMSDFFEDHPQVAPWRYEAIRLMNECPWLDFQVLTKRPENVITMIAYAADEHGNPWRDGLPDNVWIGTSVEDQERADERIPELLCIPAKVRFLSCEPLLGPVNLLDVRYDGVVTINALEGLVSGVAPAYMPFSEAGSEAWPIDWVIVGGESGPKARPMHPDWARSLRDQCQAVGVPFFFKQHGAWIPEGHAEGLWPEKANGDPVAPSRSPQIHVWPDGKSSIRYGKKKTGRLLDGREWSQFPDVFTPPE